MATNFDTSFKFHSEPLLSQSMKFRRKKGKIKTKKIQKRIRLGYRHIFLSFCLIAGLFVAFQQLYLFMISWEKFNITKIDITCDNPKVLETARKYLETKNLGNILLLDITRLKKSLESYRWIREVHMRKLFPSALNINIKERSPAAILEKKDSRILIDKDGVHLEKIDSTTYYDLPIFRDKNNFEAHEKEKLASAWRFLDNLAASEKRKIEVIKLGEYENLIVRLKENKTWLKLGKDDFVRKMQIYQDTRASLEKFGRIEYLDLRFENRLYFKLKTRIADNSIMSSRKEAE